MFGLTLAGCCVVDSAGEAIGLGGSGSSGTKTGPVGSLGSIYLGTVAADDTQAVDLARRVLLGGGSAADAATTVALALTVTEPGSTAAASAWSSRVVPDRSRNSISCRRACPAAPCPCPG